MATHLRAIRAPGAAFPGLLRHAWDDGDAVLPLPVDASDRHVAAIVERLRPDTCTELDAGGFPRTTTLPDPLPTGDDTALVVATSGSTGTPKGVTLSHRALEAATAGSLERLGWHGPWALALPVHHVAGIAVMLRSWASGTEPVVVPHRDALSSLTDLPASHVSLVPTQLHRLLERSSDARGLPTVLLGGGPVAPALLERARAAGITVVVSYGSSETCGGCVYDGWPLDGVDTDVAGDGRLRIRGPMIFDGYRGEPDRTRQVLDDAGWLITGDIARRDPDGRIELLGRADDVAVTGGENVPLAAVGAALRTHPDVADAAAHARTDAEWGQQVVAVVVPTDPGSPPPLETLRAHVRRTLPASHAPGALVLAEALPRDAMGKLTAAALDALVARS